MSETLNDFEREVYAFITARGALLTTNVPKRMMGAIPHLEKKGLVDIVKRRTSPWGPRKKKFVIVKNVDS